MEVPFVSHDQTQYCPKCDNLMQLRCVENSPRFVCNSCKSHTSSTAGIIKEFVRKDLTQAQPIPMDLTDD